MKTTFRRQFTLIASLLLLCMLITDVSFWFMLRNFMVQEKDRTLCSNAQSVANLARAYETAGELENNWDFFLSLTFVSEIGSAEALVCDEAGTVLLCSCEEFGCDHVGTVLSADFLSGLTEEAPRFSTERLEGIYKELRYLAAVPFTAHATGERTGYVVISAPMTQVTEVMHHSLLLFLYASLAVLVLALLLTTVLSRSQVRPLRQVAEAAQRFGRGDMSSRVAVSRRDTEEIQNLAQSFNAMADSLEKAEQQRKEFIANVSHELKTPMTTIGGFVDGMLDGTVPPEKHRHYMQIVSTEVRRLSRLVRNMLDISKLQAQGVDESRKSRFDVGEAMGGVLISFEQKINAKHLNVQVDLPDRAVWTRAEKDSITQVLYNLTDNAIKFCPERGVLTLALTTEGGKARVTIQNTGPTISPEELPLIFDRFHKTDKSRSADREGWGLGLYIAKTIIGAHGEDLWATSENGVTAFTFTLPLVR